MSLCLQPLASSFTDSPFSPSAVLPSPTAYFGANSSFPTSSPFDFQLFPSAQSPATQSDPSTPPYTNSHSSASDRESSPASTYLGTPGASPILQNSQIPQGQGQGQSLFGQQHAAAQGFYLQQHAKPAYQHPTACLSEIPQHTNESYPIYSTQDIYGAQGQVAAQPASMQQVHYSAAPAPIAIPMMYQMPQLGHANPPQHAHAQHYTAPAAPQQAFYPVSQHAVPQQVQYAPVQQQQQQAQAVAYSYPAPSFETPQGTYYFVPNSSANAVPVILAPAGLVRGHSAAASIGSAGSWSETEEKPSMAGKKGRKITAGKNQTKRFICPHPECGRGFARNFNMQSHLKSHLGIRDFDCPHCTKKFSRRHDRARHCAAVHDAHIDEDDGEDDGEEHSPEAAPADG